MIRVECRGADGKRKSSVTMTMSELRAVVNEWLVAARDQGECTALTIAYHPEDENCDHEHDGGPNGKTP